MNKLVVVMQVLSLLFVCPAIAEGKTDREEYGLIGPVRTVITKSSTLEKGATVESWKHAYDTKGNLTESELVYYKDDGSILGKTRTVPTYDDKGNKTEENSYGKNGLLTRKMVFTYDDNGRRIETADYGSDSSPQFRVVARFDEKGNRTETTGYKADGSIAFKNTYRYNDQGDLIESTEFNNIPSSKFNVPVKFNTVYTYSANGNRTETTIAHKADGSIDSKTVNIYNAQGTITETITYKANDSTDSKTLYNYGAKGHLIEKATYNSDNSLRGKETYAYEFDLVGNWIKKTTTKWVNKEGKLIPEPPIVTNRTITYY